MIRMFLIIIIGLTSPGFSEFNRSSNGLVVDTLTGLMWQDDYSSNNGLIKYAIFPDAIAYCENLNLGGYEDWRLPNIRELLSIIDDTRHDPAIDPVFRYISASRYWSGTTHPERSAFAWIVRFDYGGTEYNGYEKAAYNGNIRCVRDAE